MKIILIRVSSKQKSAEQFVKDLFSDIQEFTLDRLDYSGDPSDDNGEKITIHGKTSTEQAEKKILHCIVNCTTTNLLILQFESDYAIKEEKQSEKDQVAINTYSSELLNTVAAVNLSFCLQQFPNMLDDSLYLAPSMSNRSRDLVHFAAALDQESAKQVVKDLFSTLRFFVLKSVALDKSTQIITVQGIYRGTHKDISDFFKQHKNIHLFEGDEKNSSSIDVQTVRPATGYSIADRNLWNQPQTGVINITSAPANQVSEISLKQ